MGYGAGSSAYAKRDRERWLGELPDAIRPLAELLHEEHDGLVALKAKAEKRCWPRRAGTASGGC